MKIVSAICYFTLSIASVFSYEKQNYYWKEFSGTVPLNAVRAGESARGNSLYVGQANKFGKNIPGSIEQGYDGNALKIVFNNIATTAKDNIKILCAEYPEQMEWITIDVYTFRQIWNENIVIGGSYDSSYGEFPYLVGRKKIDNRAIVGGVTTTEFEMELIAEDGGEVKRVHVKNSIELLTFNPYLPKNDHTASLQPGSGYYWENYKSFIPTNAVPGGVGFDGKPTYIGQTYFNKTSICGELDPSTKSIRFVHNYVTYNIPINIMILCAHHPEQMEWVNVTSKVYWFQWQKNIVVGGYYGLYPYLVGRAVYQGRTVVGSGITHGWSAGLHINFNGTAKYVEDTFQLLSYNPNIPIEDKTDIQTGTGKYGNVYNINYNYNIRDLTVNK